MLQARGLGFSRNNQILFENLDFTIYPGQHAAIAGRNGVGKSTLFDLILGQLTADAGDLELPSTWRVVCMEQEVEVTQRAAIDFVIDGYSKLREVEERISRLESDPEADPAVLAGCHSDYADLGGYEVNAQAASILHGLGFSNAELNTPYAEFSGGWRIRLNLARALLQPADLLLLDEPTNHLDLEAIIWLEHWLAKFSGTLLLIAHDRSFLDNCTQHTLYLSGQTGKLYAGNYSSAERQRAEAMQQLQADQVKRAAKAAHMQQFIDRFRAKASKAKQVQSRLKALEKLQTSATMQMDSPYQIAFRNPERVSNPLYSIRNMDVGYAGEAVLENINQSILPGARIGILGINGAGKSTLLKAIVGELQPLSGELGRGRYAAAGYFAQHQLETLTAADSALISFGRIHPERTEQQHRDYLGGWGFSAQMLERPIRTLSGGEKARYVLATLAADEPALLVLDEPTNHLDLDMRDALVMALQDYAGAVIIVSHDRNLLAQTVDECWVIAQGKVTRFTGDIEDYTSTILNKNSKTARAEPPLASASAESTGNRKEARQERARQRDAERDLRNKLKEAERAMEKYSQTLQELESQLADSDTYNTLPADELDALLARAGRYRHRVDEAEERWLALADELEQLRN